MKPLSPATSRLLLAAAALTSPALLMLAAGTVRAQGGQRADAAAADAELPLRSITLYHSGVGYFERHGSVQGDQHASLRFDAAQVNDILKSMVLLDLDGGRINAVTYGSKEPLERRLKSFGVDISLAPGVADLFRQLRGSGVIVKFPEGEVEGTILGIESRPVQGTDDGKTIYINQLFVNLVTPSGVRSVLIPSIASFRFTDPTLNEELNKALAALAQQRAETSKTVDLSFTGDPGRLRRIVVAYIHEMPVWKTSYRLILPDDEQGAKPNAAAKVNITLQGWAIVENTTDQDWKDIRLSLASGRPVSFTMDLYQPLFALRPDVPVPFLAGIAPRVYESNTNVQSFAVTDARTLRKEAMGGAPSAAAEMGRARGPRDGGADFRYDLSGDDFASYAAQAHASAGEAGETFMYTLDMPVSLDRQRSAMLPILTTPVEGRRYSIYNAAAYAKNPMRGVKIRNASSFHLMPGPISVYDGAAYAGDAQIPHTSRDQERILSYAVDLDVLGQSENTGDESIVKIRIVDGLLSAESRYRSATRYTMTNNDSARPRVVLIEHPKMPGWDLIEPKSPAETTENLYRFELPVDASKAATLSVVQEQTRWQQYALVEYDLTLLLRYSKDGKASPAVVDAVKKAAAIRARILEQERAIADLESRRAEIREEQSRIRSNMNALDRTSDLYRRYVTKLNEQESLVEEISTKRDAAQAARIAAEEELRDYLLDLDVQ